MRRVNLPEVLADILRRHDGEMLIQWHYPGTDGVDVTTSDPRDLELWAFDSADFSAEGPPVEAIGDDEAWLSDGERFYARAALGTDLREWRELRRRREAYYYRGEGYLSAADEEVLSWLDVLAPASFYGCTPRCARWVDIPLTVVWRPEGWSHGGFYPVYDGVIITPRNIQKVAERGTAYLDWLYHHNRALLV